LPSPASTRPFVRRVARYVGGLFDLQVLHSLKTKPTPNRSASKHFTAQKRSIHHQPRTTPLNKLLPALHLIRNAPNRILKPIIPTTRRTQLPPQPLPLSPISRLRPNQPTLIHSPSQQLNLPRKIMLALPRKRRPAIRAKPAVVVRGGIEVLEA